MTTVQVTLPHNGKTQIHEIELVRTSDNGELWLASDVNEGGFRAVFAPGAWDSAVKIDDEED